MANMEYTAHSLIDYADSIEVAIGHLCTTPYRSCGGTNCPERQETGTACEVCTASSLDGEQPCERDRREGPIGPSRHRQVSGCARTPQWL